MFIELVLLSGRVVVELHDRLYSEPGGEPTVRLVPDLDLSAWFSQAELPANA